MSIIIYMPDAEGRFYRQEGKINNVKICKLYFEIKSINRDF